MDIRRFDCIIIGGGPAGSTAARRLALCGRKAVLLEKRRFPRQKVCAGWVTPGIFPMLGFKPSEYPGTLQEFSSAIMIMDGRCHETRYPSVSSYGIIRSEFDNFLLGMARDSGVCVREDIKIAEIFRDNEGVSVYLSNGDKYRADIIIGAGGSNCPVARKFGARAVAECCIVAQESETRFGADLLRSLTPYYGTSEIIPEDDFFGYGWYVTKGDWLNIGLGRFNHRTKNLKQYRHRLIKRLEGMGRLKGIADRLEPFTGHHYKLYDEVPRKIYGEHYLLVGDSGGFASKWAGEGIKPAVQSAILAAEVADRALTKNDPSENFLSSYRSLCDSAFGSQKRSLFSDLITSLPDGFKKRIVRRICLNSALRKKIVFNYAFGFDPAGEEK